MLRVYRKFLESPSRSSYLAARDWLLRRPGFPPRINALLGLSDLLRRGEHSLALAQAMQMVPDWVLSPRLHFFRAMAAEALGDPQLVQLARFEMAACLDGLIATGNGSRSHPYIVTYLSDVLDVLHYERQTARRRGVVIDGEAPVDCVTCTGGEQRFFCHPPWVATRQSLPAVGRRLSPLHA